MNSENKQVPKWFWAFLLLVAPLIRLGIGVLITAPVWAVAIWISGRSVSGYDFIVFLFVPVLWSIWGLKRDINKYKEW